MAAEMSLRLTSPTLPGFYGMPERETSVTLSIKTMPSSIISCLLKKLLKKLLMQLHQRLPHLLTILLTQLAS